VTSERARADRVLAAVLVCLALAVLGLAAELPGGSEADPVGPRGFPALLGLVLLACGLALGVTAGRRPGDDEEAAARGALAATPVVAAVGLTAAYLAVLEPAGFLLATPPYVAALLLARGGVPARTFALAALGLPLGLYVLFALAMRVPLPLGPLEPLLRAL
jgi:putative tricarboxylic transport membrane protein